jgi:hypothetical protein
VEQYHLITIALATHTRYNTPQEERMQQSSYQSLQWSESVILSAASRIFAAYITAGKMWADNEDEMMLKAIQTAIKMSDKVDAMVKSDDEGKR